MEFAFSFNPADIIIFLIVLAVFIGALIVALTKKKSCCSDCPHCCSKKQMKNCTKIKSDK